MTDVELTSLRNRDVLDVGDATVVGRVADVVLDVSHRHVVALIVAKGPKGSPVLPWDRVLAIGPDAVTIRGVDALRAPEGRLEHGAASGDHDAVGKPVLTADGDAAGRLDDISLDTETGALSSLRIDGQLSPAEDLVAIGSFAAIVRPRR